MIDDLANAIVTQLNAQYSPGTFTAIFHDSPLYTTADLATLRVTVLPFGELREAETRGADRIEYRIDVGFEKKAPLRPSGVDDLAAFSKELRDLMQGVAKWLSVRANRIPPTYSSAWLKTIKHSPLYDAEQLRTKREFVGVLSLTYVEHERP